MFTSEMAYHAPLIALAMDLKDLSFFDGPYVISKIMNPHAARADNAFTLNHRRLSTCHECQCRKHRTHTPDSIQTTLDFLSLAYPRYHYTRRETVSLEVLSRR